MKKLNTVPMGIVAMPEGYRSVYVYDTMETKGRLTIEECPIIATTATLMRGTEEPYVAASIIFFSADGPWEELDFQFAHPGVWRWGYLKPGEDLDRAAVAASFKGWKTDYEKWKQQSKRA